MARTKAKARKTSANKPVLKSGAKKKAGPKLEQSTDKFEQYETWAKSEWRKFKKTS